MSFHGLLSPSRHSDLHRCALSRGCDPLQGPRPPPELGKQASQTAGKLLQEHLSLGSGLSGWVVGVFRLASAGRGLRARRAGARLPPWGFRRQRARGLLPFGGTAGSFPPRVKEGLSSVGHRVTGCAWGHCTPRANFCGTVERRFSAMWICSPFPICFPQSGDDTRHQADPRLHLYPMIPPFTKWANRFTACSHDRVTHLPFAGPA